MNIGFVRTANYEKLWVRDVEIRRTDRMQFVTGIYYQSTATPGTYDQSSCFVGRVSTKGDYEAGKYLFKDTSYASECYNLALVPRLNYIVAVGYAGSKSLPGKAMIYLMDQNLNSKFVKVWTTTNDAYYTGASMYSLATDVEVSTSDGSIYVTGYIVNSFNRGTQASPSNCFIMKLDTELNLVYAKSFGVNGENIQCLGLQLTRNAEFIYFGGYRVNAGNKDLFFSKSNGNGDFMVTTFYSFGATYDVTFKRILLEKSLPFSSYQTTSTGKLYFCGLIKDAVSQDFMYGQVQSGDVESYLNTTASQASLISVQYVYRYGSSFDEIVGDCAISDDNNNLMASFSTNYHTSRPAAMNDIWTANDGTDTVKKSTMAGLTYGGQSYYYYTDKDPYTLTCGYCAPCSQIEQYSDTYTQTQNILSYTPATPIGAQNNLNQIQDDCEDPVKNSIMYYTQYYDKQMYSWHQCKNYWWAFSAVDDCQIDYLRLTQCSAGPPQIDSDGSCCGWCGTCNCGQSTECDKFLTRSNNYRPWYTNGCYQQEQRTNIYTKLLSGNDYMRQYMFCYNSDAGTGSCTEDDEFFMVFEQDCTKQGTYQYSIFVARFNLIDIGTGTHLTSNPQIAAYLGDDNGNIYVTAMALDQYGYVYLHSHSDATGFGANTSPQATYVWVHLKTHWDLATEYEFDYSLEIDYGANTANVYFKQADNTQGAGTGTPWTQWYGKQFNNLNEKAPGFLGKKFTIPRKFQNVVSAADGTITFLSLVTGTADNKDGKAYMMNEELYDLSTIYAGFSFSSITSQHYIWGSAYAKVASREDINIYKDSSTQTTKLSFNVPNICANSVYSTLPLNKYRELISGKQPTMLLTSTSSSPFTITSSSFSTLDYFTGNSRLNVELGIQVNLNHLSLLEGIYYVDILIATDDKYPWSSVKKQCRYGNHGYFWNTAQFNSRPYTHVARFQTAYRVRILVDEEQAATNSAGKNIQAPSNGKDIEDIFPIVGLRTTLQITVGDADENKNHFNGNCDRYFAKQQKLKVTNAVPVTIDTEVLPHWISFYERNKTFEFYPIIYSPDRKIAIELACCNTIEQCVSQTFHVQVKNTQPVSDFAQLNTYVIQYDDQATIGQEFSWEMRNTYFYDVDKASDTANTSNYNVKDDAYRRTDHTVDMDFTDTIVTFSNQFRHIKRLGMIFGQAALSIVGLQTVNYDFRDNFITTALQYGNLKIYINKMPTVTTAGSTYVFSLMDPLNYGKTDYFDMLFPFLNNDDLLTFEVDTSLWFTDDVTDTLTYGLTRSDNTPRPDWMDFDIVNGQMSGFPNMSEQSELYQLKFTVQDQQQGTNKVYKQMLLNTKPQARNMYKVLEIGVNRQFAYNVEDMIGDINGDFLTFSLPQSGDAAKLSAYGVSFNDATKSLYGKPTRTGLIPVFPVRGTDPHGYYVDVYFTIKIYDYQLARRNYRRFYDREIIEFQRFEFQLEDDMFYDQKDRSTLVYFAYDPADLPLPKWIQFMPHTRTFTGIAPKRGTQQVVEVRAMNTYSHDSLSAHFKITVIPNPKPRTKIDQIPVDITIKQNEWIDHQVPILIFKESNLNYMPQILIFSANGQDLPSFLKFNPINRTLYGHCIESGIYRVDFQFSDDQGQKTFSNIKVTVLASEIKSYPVRNYYHYAFAGTAVLSLLIYLAYLFHVNWLIQIQYKIQKNTEKDANEARKRFGDYREIDIKFKKPQNQSMDQLRLERLREAIKYTGGEAGAYTTRTLDYNFSVNDVSQSQVHNPFENTETAFQRTNDKLFNEYYPKKHSINRRK